MVYQTQEKMLASLDRVMRLLKRCPTSRSRHGRGVYRLLTIINETNNTSTRDLAELLDVRPSSLNERLVLLEQEELIRRERDPNDQRVFLVELLPKGKQHLDTIIQEQRKFNEELGKILTKEESETFVFLTEKLAKGLEPLTITEEKKRRHHHHSKKDYL